LGAIRQVQVDSIVLNKSTLELEVGKEERLHATLAPDNASDKRILWKSDDERVATVDANGLVRAISTGKAVIRAVSADGSKMATCTLTVVVPVSGVRLEGCETSPVAPGQTRQLSATVEPDGATNEGVLWSTSNPEVATVDEDGLVTAGDTVGTAIVTATTEDGDKTATCVVTVAIPVTGVTVSGCLTTTLTPGHTRQLGATVAPDNATNRNVSWTSSNTSVATVNNSGLVTAGNTGGAAIITATTQDGEQTATCNVTVVIPVTGVTVNGCLTSSLPSGQTRQLSATVAPANATNKAVTWTSSNDNIARVNASTGLVTAGNTAGTATIRATTADGGKTTTCAVPVTIPVASVSISGCPPEIPPGQSRTLSATVLPSNATNKGVTWESSNTAVATVSSTGELWLRRSGTATITVRTHDSGKTATCNVRAQHIIESVCRIFGLYNTLRVKGRGFIEVSNVTVDNKNVPYSVTNSNEILITSSPSLSDLFVHVWVGGNWYYWYQWTGSLPYC